MPETLRRQEDIPASYPDASDGLSTEAAALDPALTWQRIEAYIAHRYTPRSVTWIVEGEGNWQPDLYPVTISTVEVWELGAWSETTLTASPLGGYALPGDGPYRFTGEAGGQSPADVPAAIVEAYRRLAEYFAEQPDRAGAGRYEASVGPINEGYDRSPKWIAQAMQLSGAADLLRPYRRAP